MNSRVAPLLCLISLTATGCIIPDDATPSVSLSSVLATKFVHRGMTQSENGVMQPKLAVGLPTTSGDSVTLTAQGNMDLSDDNGDAWFPRGHGGRFSEIDFVGAYTHRFEDVSVFSWLQLGAPTVTGGLFNYNLPNGLEFPFGERGATSEFLVEGQMQLSERYFSIVPSLAIHYDFDEVEGFYIRTGVERAFPINEKLTITSDLGLAWMDGDQAFWNFAEPGSSGLGDLTLRGTAEYIIDDHTTATGFLAYSTLLASAYRDWFDLIGINPDQLFLGLGVRWSY